MKNQKTIERFYKIGMWIAGLTILAMFISLVSLEASEIRDEMPKVIYECAGSETITYNYTINGIILVDLDTGAFHNVYKCVPINAPLIKWEMEK